MKTFSDILNQYEWENIRERIQLKTTTDVINALSSQNRSIEDFMALVSPAASFFIEEMAQQSHAATVKRFGKTIQMFIPMYLSNECQNICTYCGFSLGNKIPRKTLSEKEIEKEIELIKELGFDHILVLTGEDRIHSDFNYILNSIKKIKPHFSNLSIEVQPFEQDEYEKLIEAGCDAVLVYQETYNRNVYKQYHTKGKKSNFDYRLQTPDRLGKAGIHKIGIGALLGLEDWRTEVFFLALHLRYLQKNYWKTQYSISLPRIRPAEGVDDTQYLMNDKEFVQLICALRLFDGEIELTLSTREAEGFREKLIPLGITNLSAGAKTNPGGYDKPDESLEQFEISDERSPEEMKKVISALGYETVWKNWDKGLAFHKS
ncbi:MAG: 2-iminoacetate synthase ThiH [Bacteroidia bacterium]|nr:2-iminoacetate synthase ThiH [Bacteroidia bacterium]